MIHALDSDTLVLVQACISLVLAWMMVAAAWSPRALPAQRQWAAGNVLLCIGVFVGAADSFPLWVHGALGAGLIGLGQGLTLKGIYEFRNRRFPMAWVGIIGVTIFLVAFYFVAAEPSLLNRRSAVSLLVSLLCFWCAHALTRHRADDERIMTYTSMFGFMLIGAVMLMRAWYWYVSTGVTPIPDWGQLSEHNVQRNFFLLLVPIAQVITGFGLIGLVAHRHQAALLKLSLMDELTQVYNRGAVDRLLRRVTARAHKTGGKLSLAMVDADHFKSINDTYGHAGGDEVLKDLVAQLVACSRPTDLVVRYGGEEFLVLFDGASLSQATLVVERIRAAAAASQVAWDGKLIRYTISIGLAGGEEGEYDLDRLIALADQRLYVAKREGRNRVAGPAQGDAVTGLPETPAEKQ
jgi:diguanylate cyclase (GGDEF)-like protein